MATDIWRIKKQICVQINGISYIPSGEIMSKKLKLHKMLNNPIANVDMDKWMTAVGKAFIDKSVRSTK